jgi:hypothetical protein
VIHFKFNELKISPSRFAGQALVQEEYPNPCESELFFDVFQSWIWGRWLKVINPTTPSPPVENAIRLKCGRIHPS